MRRRRPLTLSILGWCLIGLGGIPPALSAESVHGAFGMVLGAPFTPTEDPHTFTTLNGSRAYFFKPSQPSRVLDRYLVEVTPLTHRIHTIIAVGPKEDIESCEKDRSALLAHLTGKHGASFKWRPAQALPAEGYYDIILQADQKRGIGVTCSGIGAITLQVIYVDDELSDLAEQERHELERERVRKPVLWRY